MLALHARRRRQRGPAPEHLARDAAEQSASRADAQGADGPGHPELESLAAKDADAFGKVWEAFGAVIKEGLYEDGERRDALIGLARFATTGPMDGRSNSIPPISGPIRPRFTISPAKARSDSSPIPNSKQRAIAASRCCC